MAMFGPPLDEEDERRLYKNWSLLKNELQVDTIIDQLVERQVFSEDLRNEIKKVQPNTKIMRAEKLLRTIMRVGTFAYEEFCELLRNDSNRYQEVLEAMELVQRPSSEMEYFDGSKVRPNSAVSSTVSSNLTSASQQSSHSSNDGETGEKKKRTTKKLTAADFGIHFENESACQQNTRTIAQKTTSKMAIAAASAICPVDDESNELSINVHKLEEELVKIAPSIAELFDKISENMAVGLPKEHEEFNKFKHENENLRRTNRALVEKLNSFQQQIISLQLENKRLRDSGEGVKETKEELEKRADEIEELRQKLEAQKSDLEEKDIELDKQLRKIREIEKENEKQKCILINLQEQHDKELAHRLDQQQQIMELRVQRVKQQERIEMLELIQQEEDERLQMLEERLNSLEQYGSPRMMPQSTSRMPSRTKRNARIVSPPGSIPWMSGMLSRSHHAKIKASQQQPPSPSSAECREKGKGWSF